MKDKPKYYVDGAGLYYKTIGGSTYWLDEESDLWTFFCKTEELEILVKLTEVKQEQIK